MDTEIIEHNQNSPSLDLTDSEDLRQQARRATRDFKDSWRNLAKVLQAVWSKKAYKQWGYETFDQYSAQEVHVRKHTAMKLIRSYQFLEKEEPSRLEYAGSTDEAPSFEAVHTLQRAKKSLSEGDYQKIKKDIFTEKKDIGEVKKDLTSLILKRRKDVNPEEERTRLGRLAIIKFVATLESFKKDVETLHILPHNIAEDIARLIEGIQACDSLNAKPKQ
jgi:hypothetical protein